LADPLILLAALAGGAIGGVIGGFIASRLGKGSSNIELPPIDPKSIAALVAQELEASLNEIREDIGSLGEKMASVEETVSSIYQIFAAYLGATAYAASARKRRRVSKATAQTDSGGKAGESKTQ
jgi:hypothetical protein